MSLDYYPPTLKLSSTSDVVDSCYNYYLAERSSNIIHLKIDKFGVQCKANENTGI
jgi:hypothetical protein